MIKKDKNNIPYTNSGNRYKIEYSPKVNSDGTIDLIADGKFDQQEWYDAARDSCDMSIILQRWLNGDDTVLNQRKGVFGDFVDMPTSYAEILQSVIDAERMFYQLPEEIKTRFNNDWHQWFAKMDSPDFSKLMTMESKSEASSDAVLRSESASGSDEQGK